MKPLFFFILPMFLLACKSESEPISVQNKETKINPSKNIESPLLEKNFGLVYNKENKVVMDSMVFARVKIKSYGTLEKYPGPRTDYIHVLLDSLVVEYKKKQTILLDNDVYFYKKNLKPRPFYMKTKASKDTLGFAVFHGLRSGNIANFHSYYRYNPQSKVFEFVDLIDLQNVKF